MSTAARLTVAEYNRMLHAGVFDSGRRVEFIAGEIRNMTPIGPEHESAVDRLVQWSFRHVDDGSLLIRVQQSLGLAEPESVPQPDLTWVRQGDYNRARPTVKDVFLVVEVAETSLAYDLGEKADLYAVAGVQDYWVVDCRSRRIVVHREPGTSGYRSVRDYGHNDPVSPLCRPHVMLLPRTLFGSSDT
ncbi:MAG: Uma2 family endonuclease [Planctomycetes bacterium]|nr:Uma2 family endonuclease [Planctomycetota bacterium]